METTNKSSRFMFTDSDWDIWKQEYYTNIANPPTREELKEMYPDIYEMCIDTYKDCIDPTVTVEDMIYESCLEHHSQILKGELMSWYWGLPICNAYKSMSKLKEKYESQIKKQSKQEFLYDQYIIRREHINRKIFGDNSVIQLQDAGHNEITEMFDVENPTIFQKLYENYMIAFFCKFFSENKLSCRNVSSEDIERVNVALSTYMQKEYIIDQSTFTENTSGEFFDWLNENESTFLECSNEKQKEVQNIKEQITVWIYECLTCNVEKTDIDYVNNEVLKFLENGTITNDIKPIKIIKDEVTHTPKLSANDLRTFMWVIWYKYKAIRKIKQLVVAELLLALFPSSFIQDREPTKAESIRRHLDDDKGTKIKKPDYIIEELKYK